MSATLLAGELSPGAHQVRPPGSSDWLTVERSQLVGPGQYDIVLVAGGREFTTTVLTPWPARDVEAAS